MNHWEPPYELSLGQVAKIAGKTYYQIRWMVRQNYIAVRGKTSTKGHYRILASEVKRVFPESWERYVLIGINSPNKGRTKA